MICTGSKLLMTEHSNTLTRNYLCVLCGVAAYLTMCAYLRMRMLSNFNLRVEYSLINYPIARVALNGNVCSAGVHKLVSLWQWTVPRWCL